MSPADIKPFREFLEQATLREWTSEPIYWSIVVKATGSAPLQKCIDAATVLIMEGKVFADTFASKLAAALKASPAGGYGNAPTAESEAAYCSTCEGQGLVTCTRNDGETFRLVLGNGRTVEQAHAVYSCTCPHGDRIRSGGESKIPDLRAWAEKVTPVGGWPRDGGSIDGGGAVAAGLLRFTAKARSAGSSKSFAAQDRDGERQRAYVRDRMAEAASKASGVPVAAPEGDGAGNRAGEPEAASAGVVGDWDERTPF